MYLLIYCIVSYAAREASVRWWNVSAGGLLSLLKVQQSCLRHLQLTPLTAHLQRPAEMHKVGANDSMTILVDVPKQSDFSPSIRYGNETLFFFRIIYAFRREYLCTWLWSVLSGR